MTTRGWRRGMGRKRRFGSAARDDGWEDSASDEEGGEALSTAAYSGKKRGASAVDRGAISSSRGGGEDGKAAKMQRQRGTFGAEQAHQAELKIRRAKYARDFDGSHQGALAAEAERAVLRGLEGGCQTAIGAWLKWSGDRCTLHGAMEHPNGLKRSVVTGTERDLPRLIEQIIEELAP